VYLSDSDIQAALEDGSLIVDPRSEIGPTSVDLHLDSVEQARVWDLPALEKNNREQGLEPRELRVARMQYGAISRRFLVPPPEFSEDNRDALVVRRHDHIILRRGGFLLWQTRERVGTPELDPKFMCFIDGKSTRARTGLVVHLTAPTIHAGWSGNITLEMTNCGPLDLVLHEGDAVSQIVIAQISNPPSLAVASHESATFGQQDVSGAREPGES